MCTTLKKLMDYILYYVTILDSVIRNSIILHKCEKRSQILISKCTYYIYAYRKSINSKSDIDDLIEVHNLKYYKKY